MPIFPRVSLVVCRLGQPSHLHGSAPSAPSPSCPKPPQGTCCGNPGAGGGGPTGGAIGAARAAASPMGGAGGGKPPGGSNPRPGPGRDGRAESKTWGKNAIFLGKNLQIPPIPLQQCGGEGTRVPAPPFQFRRFMTLTPIAIIWLNHARTPRLKLSDPSHWLTSGNL